MKLNLPKHWAILVVSGHPECTDSIELSFCYNLACNGMWSDELTSQLLADTGNAGGIIDLD